MSHYRNECGVLIRILFCWWLKRLTVFCPKRFSFLRVIVQMQSLLSNERIWITKFHPSTSHHLQRCDTSSVVVLKWHSRLAPCPREHKNKQYVYSAIASLYLPAIPVTLSNQLAHEILTKLKFYKCARFLPRRSSAWDFIKSFDVFNVFRFASLRNQLESSLFIRG